MQLANGMGIFRLINAYGVDHTARMQAAMKRANARAEAMHTLFMGDQPYVDKFGREIPLAVLRTNSRSDVIARHTTPF